MTSTLRVFFPELFHDYWHVLNTKADIRNENYPPTNAVKLDDESILLEMALAGFSEDEIDIILINNQLTVSSNQIDTDDRNFLYKGIAKRKFQKRFTLPEYTVVKSAVFENGLLSIELVQEVPEEKKPKKIQIESKRKLLE